MMILEIYDKYTMLRLDLIQTANFIQYTNYFNEVGTFSLKVPVTEPSLKNLMVEGNYILFDENVMGVIKYFHKEGISLSTIEIKGYLVNHILTYRSFLKTKRFSGNVFDIANNMVRSQFLENENSKRNISFIDVMDVPGSEMTRYQNTGSNVAECIHDINLPFGYGYCFIPIMQSNGTGFEGFLFYEIMPIDHTMYNQDGNLPVVFSTSLDNLSELIYEEDNSEYCSIAIVAGEDVGEARKIVEVEESQTSGIDRIELYVDARDLQMEEGETEEEYLQTLKQRGELSLKERVKYVNFDGTIIVDSNNIYKYGVDYNLGDYVTIVDDTIGVGADLQISGIIKTIEGNKEYIDLKFGSQKMTIYKRIRRSTYG